MAGPFDEVLDAEEKLRLSGYEAGLSRGRVQGLADGFATGFSQGAQVADEVGFYLGFAEYMLDLSGDDVIGTPPSQPDTEAKAKRALLQVVQYITEFQCLQLSSPAYLEQLTRIRMKFKQAVSLLKVDVTQTSTATLEF